VKKGLDLYIKNLISRINFVKRESTVEEKMQKEIFVFIYLIFCIFSLGCMTVLIMSKKESAALIPISYIILAGICTYLTSKNRYYRITQAIFTGLTILLPFVLQHYLGGIRATGVLMIWSSISILNVIGIKKAKYVTIWSLVFLLLVFHAFYIEQHLPSITEGIYAKISLCINFVLVAFIHFYLSRYVIFHQIRLRIKITSHQKRLEISNANLSYRNTEISNSMDYAKHLQKSILPKQEILKEKFQMMEIFFQPKEVIGGDFYWYGECEGKKIFAIIDCTGHGIPGAFVSMMGYNLLNQIILSRKITYPGFILNQLNTAVKNSLKQESSGNKDGMDMSLITYDPISRNLEFAGAKNDLYYFDPENGLTRIKGSRCSIGGFNGVEKAQYETHSIRIKEETKFFMTTDGLIDQFGGENDKRFSTKRLKRFLELMMDKTANQISRDLIQILNDWKGSTEQIDDILFSTFTIEPHEEINRVLKIKRYNKQNKRA